MPARFDSLPISPSLLAVAAELGYERLTPVQAESIPPLLAGKDLIGQSKTGSGKTVAFAVPLLEKLELDARALQALILCPTRELCAQVARELRKLGRRHGGLRVLIVCGGEPVRKQASALERGVHIVVGTPGRVLDHLRRRTLRLGKVVTAVLDEADRMLDMGFSEDMDEILAALPASRQTVFFSATFPDSIEAMSRTHQRDAVRVTIAESLSVATPEIRQLAILATPEQKLLALFWALERYPHASALVFCNMKVTVAELTRELTRARVSTDCLHGDLEQFERDRVMAMFRNQSVRVLVATDVAARGLDVEDLELVVNFDLPHQPEIYVHRIGRTGRAGKPGLALSMASRRDNRKLAGIEALTGTKIERVERGEDDQRNLQALASSIARGPLMNTLEIAGGRKDKLRPGDILGALTGEAGGLDASAVGKIEIHDRRAFVAVASEHARAALDSLNEGRIKGRRFRVSLARGGRSPRSRSARS